MDQPLRAPWATRFLAVLGFLAVVVLAWVLVLRPWYLRWGATDAELGRALPGDGVMPPSTTQETRAITIRARPEEIWPWLVQMGQDRAGMYSFSLIENLLGCQMPAVTHIVPAWQERRVGEKVWLYPPDKLGGVGHVVVVGLEPRQALVLASPLPGAAPGQFLGTWAFTLLPIDEVSTRLVVRGRGDLTGTSVLGRVLDRLTWEPAHYVMERRMLRNLTSLAEGDLTRPVDDGVEVLLWLLSGAMLVASLVRVLLGRSWKRSLASSFVGWAVLVTLLLVQPHPGVGIALVSTAAVALGFALAPPQVKSSAPKAVTRNTTERSTV